MEKKNYDPTVKEITLLLLWLTSFKDERSAQNIFRSWKGYDFSVLGELAQEDLVSSSFQSKSVALTDAGIKLARELQAKYLGVTA